MVKLREELLTTGEEDARRAREFYGKSDDDMKRDVRILKDWLKQQPHLPDDEDDARLERLLIGNKCRLEITKLKLEDCYTFRTMYPDVAEYYNIRGEVYQEALKYVICFPLPKMTDKQERVIYFKPINRPNYKADFNFAVLMIIEYLKTFDNALSYVYFVDFAEVTFDIVKAMDLPFMQRIVQMGINALSTRLSRIIYYQAPSYVDIVMKLLRLIFKPKLMERVGVYGDMSEVSKVLPQKYLPVEFGGENGSVKLYDEWQQLFKDEYKFFEGLRNKRSKEEFRVGPIKANELFGTDGSFKKLNLD